MKNSTNLKTITSDDILGKEAVDPEGEILGVVVKLHLDPVNRTMSGITIDQGLWEPDLYIGMEYVGNFGEDVVFLNQIPYSKYKGMPVFTHDGKKIGKVSHVEWDSKGWRKLIVTNQSILIPWKKSEFSITPDQVERIGFAIILKK